jgi:hypothetical protein
MTSPAPIPLSPPTPTQPPVPLPVPPVPPPVRIAPMAAEAVAGFLAQMRHDLDVVMARLDQMDGPQAPPEGYKPLKRAAATLGFSVETLRRRALARTVASVQLGGRWFIRCGIKESSSHAADGKGET